MKHMTCKFAFGEKKTVVNREELERCIMEPVKVVNLAVSTIYDVGAWDKFAENY